jgi:hypothetical protein
VNVAVFADLHGKILLCFKLCARWEQETGEKIDLILQCGDAGIFPDPSRLDKATRKHAGEDPEELGYFHHFARREGELRPFALAGRRREAEAVLGRTGHNLVFVRGNHEDHAFLDALELGAAGPAFPVDAYSRLYCLKTAEVFEFRAGGQALRILGIGHIGAGGGGDPGAARKPEPARSEERLLTLLCADRPPAVDVLVTHQPPDCEYVRLALDALKPRYHFFGHVRGARGPVLDSNGVTLSAKVESLGWADEPGRPLRPGVMGLLRWRGPDHHSFAVLDEPWLREYTARTWRYL